MIQLLNVRSHYSVCHQRMPAYEYTHTQICKRYGSARHTSCTFQIRWHTSVYVDIHRGSFIFGHVKNVITLLALYPLPKRTNSRKLLFISISCITIIFCVHIVKYLYKLMICWKFHIIPTRNSQDMDDWNIYLHFWGHVRRGDSANKCACAKIKNRNIRNFGFYIELFHSLKHFKRSSSIFTSILSHSYEKIATMSNSIEWRYETDTCSVSHGKSHGSCNV